MPSSVDQRWVEVTASQFPHEAEGLQYLKATIPTTSPYRVWTNFEFRDTHGRWHEVDALVLGRGRLHLVELKYYSGVLRGTDHLWTRDNRRAEDSPLRLARRKAQYLASKLTDEWHTVARENHSNIPSRQIVPFIQECVFLHHPRLRSELSGSAAIGVYGLDGNENASNLPGICERLLEEPTAGRVISADQEQILAVLLRRIGLVQRRERTAGSWIIQEGALDEGDGWQDWLAYHAVLKSDRARIRFYVTPPGAGEAERVRTRKLAEHEFRIMGALAHDGLLRPRDLVESDLGVGLVYPYEEKLVRLDQWMAGRTKGLALAEQLSIIRQTAEAIAYAHRHKVVHRGLSPTAVWVREDRLGGLKILVGDWQSAGLAAQGSGTAQAAYGVTSLLHLDTPTPPKDADGAWMIDSFTAPEGAWLSATADRVRIDVFGLGALAYYVLAGRPPAASGPALSDRLRTQQGLDLAVDVPQIGPGLREAVLAATRPAPSARTADVGTFLTTLDAAETHLPARDEIDVDPLEARAGDVLAGRFRVERRLGQGSTALGLLVTDLATTAELRRVLKVALHDEAAKRLAEEADVLRRVSSPRLVALVEGPLSLHGRQALLLENAGEKTLTEVLRERARLSLDLLERYGTDLLEALVALDAAGVDQRDIKPSNLGVRESRSAGSRDRAKHLVLFDFSLSRAPASAVTAGTPPYLDPFLTGTRATYDSAAERYAASVVLFEMASGGTPVYGDPVAHPAAVPDEATVTADMFDPAVAPALVAFFDRALARDATRRHHTAADMLAVWRAAFPQEITTVAADADELAAAATPTTALARAGLSARALSAIEPLSLTTVGDLIVVDPIRLARLAGVAAPTRTEINSRAKQWRIAHPAGVRRAAPGTTGSAALPPVTDLAQVLLDHTGSRRSTSRTAMVRLVLGVGTDLDAFATQAQLAANLPTARTTARATQLLIALQEAWATDEAARDAVALLENVVDGRLSDLGGVATAHELSLALLQAASPPGLSGAAQVDHEVRRAAGLLRIVVDRRRVLTKADVAGETLTTRRRDGRVNLISTSPDLLDVAESLGREADTLVAEAGATGAGTDAVVPAERVQERLVAVVTRAQVGSPALVEPSRLARLAAATSATACVSGALELHHRDLAQATATALALKGISAAQPMTPSELRGRVGVRFPALPALPARPRLDEVLREAGLDLVFDDVRGDYHSPTSGADTTGLQTRMSTHVVVAAAPVSSDGAIGQRLLDSVRRRSFLSLGVRPDRAAKLITVLCGRYNAYVLDVTAVLVTAMREQSASKGVSWDLLRAADAEPRDSRPGQGLTAVVSLALPAVETAITDALTDAPGAQRPLVIVEAAPLARYGHADVIKRLSDLTLARGQAVWVVLPQLPANQGALLDGVPVVTSPNQFVRVDTDWVDAHAVALTDQGAHG